MALRRKRVFGVPVATVQATAEITASAKYEVQKKITEHIPADVTRAKASAWLTLLSPITQWAGLKGDQLAHKRELLRIQQEETLTAILRRAAPRLAKLEPPIRPIPVKFLVPFLENASLEEPNSELVNMWANLLVSSAENYNPTYVHYVGIISQMSAIQAHLFEAIIGPIGPRSVEISLELIEFNLLTDYIRDHFDEEGKRPPTTLNRAWARLTRMLNIEGMLIRHMEVGKKNDRQDFVNGCPSYSIYKDCQENDFSVLEALRLLHYTDTGFIQVGDRWEVKVMAYYVSSLGLAFAAACGVQSGSIGASRLRGKRA